MRSGSSLPSELNLPQICVSISDYFVVRTNSPLATRTRNGLPRFFPKYFHICHGSRKVLPRMETPLRNFTMFWERARVSRRYAIIKKLEFTAYRSRLYRCRSGLRWRPGFELCLRFRTSSQAEQFELCFRSEQT